MTLIKLVPKTRDEALADLETMAPEDRAEVSPRWIARLSDPAFADPWLLGYRIVECATGKVVGGCGFKGAPDAIGTVEICYGIDEPRRGNGFATDAARQLVEHASKADGVRTICAHTLPKNNASARVLTKNGFRCHGEVIDPEDGLVWRWELPVSSN